ncbi:abortive infection system antitoxin AbiGi family protein, partial [Pseudomonadota bacterium]
MKDRLPKSSSLFHFTGELRWLKSILLNGFAPRTCVEDTEWLNNNDKPFIAYPMCCFCDIPLSRAGVHTRFYGYYGVGMSKGWGQENGLHTVVYTQGNCYITDTLKHLQRSVEEDPNALTVAVQLVKFTKPMFGKMPLKNAEKQM